MTSRWLRIAVAASLLLVVPTASAASAAQAMEDLPPECVGSDPGGPYLELTQCTNSGSGWEASYDSGGGVPGWFVAFFVLLLVVGVATTVWRFMVVRDMADRAGLDRRDATAMSMLSDDGLTATYLAANLRQRPDPTPAPAPPTVQRSATSRLQELQELRDQGLVTAAEYDERRRAILDAL